MKRVLLSLMLLISAIGVFAANEKQSYTTKLSDGKTINIQVCDDDIFRVRVSPRSEFKTNYMERYNILKKDWESVKVTKKESAKELVLTTDKYTLIVDKKGNTLSVKDKAGNVVVDKMWVQDGNDPKLSKLGEVINEKYLKLKVAKNSGIIGDVNNPVTLRDQVETGDYKKNSIVSFNLKKGERFYGGGSTSREHIQHRGEILRMWTTYQHTEIPHPFILSSEGWGVFNNTTLKNFFDIGCTEKDVMNIYNTCDETDIYLLFGEKMENIIERYVTVVGKPFVFPRWAYGLNFGPHMSEEQFDILNDAVRFRERNFPVDMLWLEPQWMEKRYDFSTQKKWNFQKFSPEAYWLKDVYPKQEDHSLFIGRLHDLGYKLALWLCAEYDGTLVEEDILAAAEGKKTSGQEHWMDHLMNFVDGGIDGFKIDPARTIDEHPTREYYNGSSDKEMHNLQQIIMPKQFNTTFKKHTGKRPFVHYTAGWSGTQQYTACTSGDNGGGRTALFDQVNLGMSGVLNTSCDIMNVEKDLEMASLHFGIFLPWMQINSWYSLMHPWYMNKAKERVYTEYLKLRYSLLPYIYSAALEGNATGMPIVRSMPMMFPDDRKCDDMVYQYMFGQNFLVGIFTDEIYLPEGKWYDYWTNEELQGGRDIKHTYPENRTGLLFVREGAIIPQQYDMDWSNELPNDKLILKVFPGCKATSYVLREDDGVSYEYEKGKVAKTCYEFKPYANSFEILINPTEGDYKGIYTNRVYELQVVMSQSPKSVVVNGSQVSDWSYENGVLNVKVTQADVRKALSIVCNK